MNRDRLQDDEIPGYPLTSPKKFAGNSDKGSRHANMKELRFDADDGVWRVAFAFDPKRKAILLVAGDKSGGTWRRSALAEPIPPLWDPPDG